MKTIVRSMFSMVMVGMLTISSAVLAEKPKCSACQMAKSMRDAAAQSLKDAQMAALAAGGAFSRDAELDEDSVLNSDAQQELKMSLVEAAAAVLAVAENLVGQAAQLDVIPMDALRAPREELIDPCNTCGSSISTGGSCNISEQLCALRCCCASVAHKLTQQGKEARKCCKKIKHKIDDVEDLVETLIDQTTDCCSVTESLLVSVIDQSAECCSVIESRIGDPATASFLDIPLCAPITVIDALINSTDADVLTWLKSIYELLYRVHICTCCNVG